MVYAREPRTSRQARARYQSVRNVPEKADNDSSFSFFRDYTSAHQPTYNRLQNADDCIVSGEQNTFTNASSASLRLLDLSRLCMCSTTHLRPTPNCVRAPHRSPRLASTHQLTALSSRLDHESKHQNCAVRHASQSRRYRCIRAMPRPHG